MKPEHKNYLKNRLKDRLGREPYPHEEANAQTDALVLIDLINQRLDQIEDKINLK